MDDVNNLNIGIRALTVSKYRVIIIIARICCQVSRAVIGLFGVLQIYGRRQLGARTQGIGQKITNEIFVVLIHIV